MSCIGINILGIADLPLRVTGNINFLTLKTTVREVSAINSNWLMFYHVVGAFGWRYRCEVWYSVHVLSNETPWWDFKIHYVKCVFVNKYLFSRLVVRSSYWLILISSHSIAFLGHWTWNWQFGYIIKISLIINVEKYIYLQEYTQRCEFWSASRVPCR